MRNIMCMGILMLALALAAPASAADEKKTLHSPKESTELTGDMWLSSSKEEKLAFLLGVEMTIATERYLAQKTRDMDKKERREKSLRRNEPSTFARGWLLVFKDLTRPELMDKLDAYIEATPEARGSHIFESIWKGFIEPGLKQARMARKGGNA